jgi:phosphonate degradation associated HDIG domain protein
MMHLSTVDQVFAWLASGGGTAYFGEPVSVLEHSLQAAWIIRQNGGDETLVAAALLHDVGHLLHLEGEDAARRGLDTRHEELGVAALAGHLPDAVLDPIRMHVAAKRYLCFAEPKYLNALSPASVESLTLQGGPMTATDAETYLALPHAREALRLRRADDAAKIAGLVVPELDSYRPLVTGFWQKESARVAASQISKARLGHPDS